MLCCQGSEGLHKAELRKGGGRTQRLSRRVVLVKVLRGGASARETTSKMAPRGAPGPATILVVPEVGGTTRRGPAAPARLRGRRASPAPRRRRRRYCRYCTDGGDPRLR